MIPLALEAAEQLAKEGIQVRVVNARFIKPMDEAVLMQLAKEDIPVVTLEEGAQMGGFGSGVLEYYSLNNIYGMRIKLIGVPDYFVEHGSVKEQRQEVGLTAERLITELQSLVPRKKQRA